MREVIIVGGGPIGSITGTLLARKNVDVLIIEKQKHPRWKPCGEGLSKEGMEFLKQYDLYSPVKNLFRDINGVSFNILGTNIAFHEYDTPVAYTLDRTEFDHSLISNAQDTGAEVHESETVKNINALKKEVQVETQQRCYNSKVLIGADGVFSVVGKKLYRKWANNEIGSAEVARYKLNYPPPTVKANAMEYYFFGGGYGWIFPRMEDEYLVLNIGIAADNRKIRHLFNWFTTTLESIKDIKLKGHEIDGKIWRHQIPVGGPCRGIYTNSTLLVGDAGGFVNPLTGGGLRYGTLSAIYAAETIIKFLNNEIESLQLYEDKWQRDIKPVFDKAFKIRNKVYFMSPMHLLTEMQRHPEMREHLLQSFLGKSKKQ